MKSFIIPDTITSIGNGVFSMCKGLTSITIPNSVTSIGSSAFYACTSLKNIVIGDNVTSIGSSAFWIWGSNRSITFKGKTYTSNVEFNNYLKSEGIAASDVW